MSVFFGAAKTKAIINKAEIITNRSIPQRLPAKSYNDNKYKTIKKRGVQMEKQ